MFGQVYTKAPATIILITLLVVCYLKSSGIFSLAQFDHLLGCLLFRSSGILSLAQKRLLALRLPGSCGLGMKLAIWAHLI